MFDSDHWVSDYIEVCDFQFDPNLSGIQINVPESVLKSPIEIFRQIGTDEIFKTMVYSTNTYGQKTTLQNRPHNKSSRKSAYKTTDKKEVEKFLGLYLLFGSAKFSVLYGIKFFELCSSDGYVLNIEMYKGKNLLVSQNSEIDSLVLRLIYPY